jgi:hypothetical protein
MARRMNRNCRVETATISHRPAGRCNGNDDSVKSDASAGRNDAAGLALVFRLHNPPFGTHSVQCVYECFGGRERRALTVYASIISSRASSTRPGAASPPSCARKAGRSHWNQPTCSPPRPRTDLRGWTIRDSGARRAAPSRHANGSRCCRTSRPEPTTLAGEAGNQVAPGADPPNGVLRNKPTLKLPVSTSKDSSGLSEVEA